MPEMSRPICFVNRANPVSGLRIGTQRKKSIMSSEKFLGKGVTAPQFDVFQSAAKRAGLSRADALEQALKAFVEAHGGTWPLSDFGHGGHRKKQIVSLLIENMAIRREIEWKHYHNAATAERFVRAEFAQQINGRWIKICAEKHSGLPIQWAAEDGDGAVNVVAL